MPSIGVAATTKVAGILSGSTGLQYTLGNLTAAANLTLPAISPAQVKTQNIAFDIAERTTGVTYPALYVYCDSLQNQLKEKFRTFSGKASLVMEVRATDDSTGSLADNLHLYASAATAVLDANRGDWGSGMFYTGGYKVEFGPVKRGGRNFLQTAKISFDVDISY